MPSTWPRPGNALYVRVRRPAYDAGTMEELLAIVAVRLRGAAEAIEAPNEYTSSCGPRWSSCRLSSYSRLL